MPTNNGTSFIYTPPLTVFPMTTTKMTGKLNRKVSRSNIGKLPAKILGGLAITALMAAAVVSPLSARPILAEEPASPLVKEGSISHDQLIDDLGEWGLVPAKASSLAVNFDDEDRYFTSTNTRITNALVDDAEEAGYFTDSPAKTAPVIPSHDQLMDDLGEFGRGVNADVGESLEELYGPEAETHAAELAHHFAEAEAVSGTDKLVRYSLMAGQRALAAHAYEEAVAHIERGLEAKGVALTDTDPAVDGEAAALLFCLGQAQAAMSPSLHQLSDATNSLERAFQFYLDTGDADQAVAVAEYHLLHPSVMARMASMISRTLEMVPPDSHHAGRILPAYGYTLFATSGEYREAQEAFGRALVIAERVADETLQMRTLARAAEAAWWNLQLPDIIEYGRRASELSGRVDDPAFEVHARQYLARALAVTGESEAAQLEEATVLAMTESLRDRNRLVGVLTMRAESCFFRGEWEEARALIDRQASSPRLLSTLAVLEHEVGDFDRGAAIVDQLIEERSRTALSLTGFT